MSVVYYFVQQDLGHQSINYSQSVGCSTSTSIYCNKTKRIIYSNQYCNSLHGFCNFRFAFRLNTKSSTWNHGLDRKQIDDMKLIAKSQYEVSLSDARSSSRLIKCFFYCFNSTDYIGRLTNWTLPIWKNENKMTLALIKLLSSLNGWLYSAVIFNINLWYWFAFIDFIQFIWS